MIRFSKIPRLAERMNVMIFLGNFNDTAQLLMPVGVGGDKGWLWVGGLRGGGILPRDSHGSPPTHSNSTPSSPPPCPSSPPANCATSLR